MKQTNLHKLNILPNIIFTTLLLFIFSDAEENNIMQRYSANFRGLNRIKQQEQVRPKYYSKGNNKKKES